MMAVDDPHGVATRPDGAQVALGFVRGRRPPGLKPDLEYRHDFTRSRHERSAGEWTMVTAPVHHIID
jgi:hypothetical protein